MVIPRDAICLDEEFKAVRIENSMQAPERLVGRLDPTKQALSVVHVSQKAKFDMNNMNNKTNLKRIDKENENRSYHGPRGAATSANTLYTLSLHEGKPNELKPAVKMRTLI